VGNAAASTIDHLSQRTATGRPSWLARRSASASIGDAWPAKNATTNDAGKNIIRLRQPLATSSSGVIPGVTTQSAHRSAAIAPGAMPAKKATAATVGNAVINGVVSPSHGAKQNARAHARADPKNDGQCLP
jgi:hypothetical protein